MTPTRPDLEAEWRQDEMELAVVESPDAIAKRFDLPVQWAQLHIGVHRCVDDRWYRVSCLVSDPSCDRVARSYMRKRETRSDD